MRGQGRNVLASGELVFVFATQALGFAIDHLKAWESWILGGLHPAFAQMTLLRAALEGAATARWLLDLEVTPTERVGHGIASAVDDLIEVRRFELSVESTSSQPRPGEAVDARIAELKRIRPEAGIPEVRYPTATKLFETYGGDQGDAVWLFRLVSAFAHSKQWAIAGTDRGRRTGSDQTEWRSTAAGRQDEADAADSVSGRFHLGPAAITHLTSERRAAGRPPKQHDRPSARWSRRRARGHAATRPGRARDGAVPEIGFECRRRPTDPYDWGRATT